MCSQHVHVCTTKKDDHYLVCLCSRILSESEIDVHLVALSEREWGRVGSHFAAVVITRKRMMIVNFRKLCLLGTKDSKRGGGVILFRRGDTTQWARDKLKAEKFWTMWVFLCGRYNSLPIYIGTYTFSILSGHTQNWTAHNIIHISTPPAAKWLQVWKNANHANL